MWQGPDGDRLALPRGVFAGGRPTPAHRALAVMTAQGLLGPFLTTNFDRLLEQAMADAGHTPVVAYDLGGMTGMTGHQELAGPVVVKLHGAALLLGHGTRRDLPTRAGAGCRTAHDRPQPRAGRARRGRPRQRHRRRAAVSTHRRRGRPVNDQPVFRADVYQNQYLPDGSTLVNAVITVTAA